MVLEKSGHSSFPSVYLLKLTATDTLGEGLMELLFIVIMVLQISFYLEIRFPLPSVGPKCENYLMKGKWETDGTLYWDDLTQAPNPPSLTSFCRTS